MAKLAAAFLRASSTSLRAVAALGHQHLDRFLRPPAGRRAARSATRPSAPRPRCRRAAAPRRAPTRPCRSTGRRTHESSSASGNSCPVNENARLPDQLAGADRQHDDLQRDALAVKAEHVLIDEVAPTPPAAPPASLHRADLIAHVGGELELGRARRRPSCARAGASSSSSLLPSRNRRTSRTCSPYRSRATGSTHGRRAALDLVLQAGPPAVVQHVVGAGAQLEVAVHHPQRLAARGRRVVRAEVARAVVADACAPPRAAATPPSGRAAAPGSSCRRCSLTLKRGWCCLISVFSSSSASFSFEVTTVSMSATIPSSSGTKSRLSPVPGWKYCRTRLRRLGRLADVDHLAARVLHQVDARLGPAARPGSRRASSAAAPPRRRAGSAVAARRSRATPAAPLAHPPTSIENHTAPARSDYHLRPHAPPPRPCRPAGGLPVHLARVAGSCGGRAHRRQVDLVRAGLLPAGDDGRDAHRHGSDPEGDRLRAARRG